MWHPLFRIADSVSSSHLDHLAAPSDDSAPMPSFHRASALRCLFTESVPPPPSLPSPPPFLSPPPATPAGVLPPRCQRPHLPPLPLPLPLSQAAMPAAAQRGAAPGRGRQWTRGEVGGWGDTSSTAWRDLRWSSFPSPLHYSPSLTDSSQLTCGVRNHSQWRSPTMKPP